MIAEINVLYVNCFIDVLTDDILYWLTENQHKYFILYTFSYILYYLKNPQRPITAGVTVTLKERLKKYKSCN